MSESDDSATSPGECWKLPKDKFNLNDLLQGARYTTNQSTDQNQGKILRRDRELGEWRRNDGAYSAVLHYEVPHGPPFCPPNPSHITEVLLLKSLLDLNGIPYTEHPSPAQVAEHLRELAQTCTGLAERLVKEVS